MSSYYLCVATGYNIPENIEFKGLPMDDVLRNESGLEEDKSSNEGSNTNKKVGIEELAVECIAKRSVIAPVYHLRNERNNNLVLQLVLNFVTNEITSLRHFLDRKESEIFWYRRLITMKKKDIANLRKEMIQAKKRNMDLNLRNESLEALVESLKEQTKRSILLSRCKKKKTKFSKLVEVCDMLPDVGNGKFLERCETSNNIVGEKYQDKMKKIEDTLAQVLEDNKSMHHAIYEKLESLKKFKKSWRWKTVRKLMKRYHNILGNVKEPVLKMFQKKMNFT